MSKTTLLKEKKNQSTLIISLCLVEVWVALDLVRGGLDLRLLQDLRDLLRVEVRDSDGAHQALLHKLLHGEVGLGGADVLVVLETIK